MVWKKVNRNPSVSFFLTQFPFQAMVKESLLQVSRMICIYSRGYTWFPALKSSCYSTMLPTARPVRASLLRKSACFYVLFMWHFLHMSTYVFSDCIRNHSFIHSLISSICIYWDYRIEYNYRGLFTMQYFHFEGTSRFFHCRLFVLFWLPWWDYGIELLTTCGFFFSLAVSVLWGIW